MSIPPILLAGLAAGGAALGRGLFAGYPDRRVAHGLLSGKEEAVVAACADTFFPSGGPIPISGTQAGLVEYFEKYFARLPEGQRILVRLLVWFIEHGPWVFGPRRVRFTDLAERDRLAVLESMRTSPIYFRRVAFLSMRTMLTMGYLAHPDVARAMRMSANTSPFESRAA
ncbi:MAG: hypothetical protein HOW73_13835 [Polyangiaceae bacterium]|nr:hypothetical protein [Polyangiaceae bacterium]